LGVGIAVIDPEELTRLVLKFSVREEGGAVLRRYFRYGMAASPRLMSSVTISVAACVGLGGTARIGWM
jgi:hypothetical protein